MKYKFFIMALLLLSHACKCPEMLSPKITVNASQIEEGQSLMMAVPSIKGATVLWTGPDSSFRGDPWIRKNVGLKMTGGYAARYVCNRKKHVVSTADSVSIQIYNPTIGTTTYQGQQYDLTLKWVGPDSAQVWMMISNAAQPKTGAGSVGNTLLAQLLLAIYFTKITPADIANGVVNSVKFVDNASTAAGCFATAGAVGCALGVALTGPVVIPECVVLLDVSEPAMLACVKGAVGAIASSVGLETPWQAANLAVAIKSGEIEPIIENSIEFADDVKSNVLSVYQNGHVEPAPPPIVVTPPAPPVRPPAPPPVRPPAPPINPVPINPCEGCDDCCIDFCGDCGGGGVIDPGDGEFLDYKVMKSPPNDLKNYLDEAIKSNPTSDSAVEPINLFDYAEAVLFRKFGRKAVEKQRPYKIYQFKGYWIIQGSKGPKHPQPTFSLIMNTQTGSVVKIESK